LFAGGTIGSLLPAMTKTGVTLQGRTARAINSANLSEPNADGENNSSSDNDLDNGVAKSAAHEAVTDECDCDEFDEHHRIGELQCETQVWNKERKRMEHPSKTGCHARDRATLQRPASARDTSII
jgi:hypothetical protein